MRTLQCKTCGTDFEWDHTAGGRPPLYCDEHKSTVTLQNQLRSARARKDEARVKKLELLLEARKGNASGLGELPVSIRAALLATGMHATEMDAELAADLVGLDPEDPENEKLIYLAGTKWKELQEGAVAPLLRLLDAAMKAQAILSVADEGSASNRAQALTRIAQTVAQLHANSSGAFSNEVEVHLNFDGVEGEEYEPPGGDDE